MYVFAVVLMVLVGWLGTFDASAGEPESEALVIAKASGLKKLRDVTERDMARAVKASGAGPTGTLSTHAVGSATGLMAPPPGISATASAGISGALALLGSMPADRPERLPRFLVWLPQSEASNSTEARRKATEAIKAAIASAFPSSTVELARREEHPRTVLRIAGPLCDSCVISTWVFDNEPRVLEAPALLGGQKAYAWGGFNNTGVGTLDGYPLTDPDLSSQDRLGFYQQVSAHLPSWILVYLPPDERLAPYPQILRSGEILLFVEPGLYAQVSAKSREEEHAQKEAK